MLASIFSGIQLLIALGLLLLCIGVILFAVILTPRPERNKVSDDEEERRREASDNAQQQETQSELERVENVDRQREREERERQRLEEARRREEEAVYRQAKQFVEEKIERVKEVLRPPEPEWWEKYDQVYRFEILYWRGVERPSWWNNYAKELVEYADANLPHKKLDFYATYNINRNGEEFQIHRKRIEQLRPYKLSKHPLVVINYDQEFILVKSEYQLEAMFDRIDAEWYRHYRFNKTYRKH